MTFCASLCWKSLSQPFLCNLDSTPPQVINAAANDGEPCSGGQSPSSQDSVPIHGGVPEFSGSVRDRPDFTLLQKSEGRPQFLFKGEAYLDPVFPKTGEKREVLKRRSAFFPRVFPKKRPLQTLDFKRREGAKRESAVRERAELTEPGRHEEASRPGGPRSRVIHQGTARPVLSLRSKCGTGTCMAVSRGAGMLINFQQIRVASRALRCASCTQGWLLCRSVPMTGARALHAWRKCMRPCALSRRSTVIVKAWCSMPGRICALSPLKHALVTPRPSQFLFITLI